jgi:flagellar protein FlgJ
MAIALARNPTDAARVTDALATTKAASTDPKVRARAAAEDFESVFLNTMFQQMFTGIGKEGPLGDGPATGTWRSFLIDAYARSVSKAGGIGIADHVYSSLIAHQEGRKS